MLETVMHESGYDANFEAEPPDYLKCIICALVLRDPVMIVDCGHRFCKGCYEKMKDYAKSVNIPLLCPHDRTEVVDDKVVDDKGIARVTLDLKVKCDKFEEGCEWTGELRDLQVHVNKNCEKVDLRLLILTLTKRLEDCETRLNKKDLEINKLQEELKTSKESKKNVNKRLGKCEELLKERELQIQTLTNDLKSEVEQVKTSILEAMNESKAKVEQAKKNAKKEPKQAKKQQENVGFGESTPPADVSSTKQKQTKKNSKKAVSQTAENNTINLIDGFTVTKMIKATILDWKINNYSAKQSLGETLFSPTFDTCLTALPCRFVLNWNGKQKGRLSIYVLFVDSTLIQSPYDMTFIAYDEHGNPSKNCGIGISVRSTKVTTKPSGTVYEGFGYDDFLIMPALSNYVVNDTLNIKCIISSCTQTGCQLLQQILLS